MSGELFLFTLMSANGMGSRTPYIVSREKGIATLLILVLVAIAISAAVLGTLRYVQGTQNQSLALNAQSRAQVVAWSGVELLLEYFQELTDPDGGNDFYDIVSELNTALKESDGLVDISADTLKAAIVDIYPDPDEDSEADTYRVTIDVTGLAGQGRAAASSTIQVIYALARGGGDSGGCSPFCADGPPSVITFNRDLRLSGSITVTTTPGQSYEINVKGVVTTGGNSITGVDTIKATDSINIGSGSTFKNLISNGDISLSGSVRVTENVLAVGNICVSGGAWPGYPGLMQANGFVYVNMSGTFGTLKARGASQYSGSNPQCDSYAVTDNSTGQLFGVRILNNTTVGNIESMTSVHNHGGAVSYLSAQGNLHNNYGSVAAGIISGQKRYCSQANSCDATFPAWKNDVNVTSNASHTVSVNTLQPFDVVVTGFNAYDYESSANYVFKYDTATQQRKVTVKNVQGINNGTYVLMTYKPSNTTYHDYLCSQVSGSTCLDDPSSRKTICKTSDSLINNEVGKYQNSNTCFVYQNGRWSVGGAGTNISIAQGIAWFEGDLEVKTGNFYNTFIATGNILTSGSHRNAAPNFAGAAGSGTYSGLTLKGICSNAYFPYYPTQICNAFSANEPLPIANYAYMAGSISGNNYVGGNIKLGASTVAYGSVLAGNEFDSSGNTTVYGYITALGGGAQTYNAMGGSTTIIVNQLPPTYIPMGGIDVGGGNEEGPVSTSPSVEVLWTRYL